MSIERKTLIENELGLSILSKFYLFLLFFHLISPHLFYTRTFVGTHQVGGPSLFAARAALALLLFWLYGAIKRGSARGFWCALFFHSFFLLNNLCALTRTGALVRVEGLQEGVASLGARPILIISTVFNSLVTLYCARRLFMRHRPLT
ncbi:MAG: hypothetical protein ABH865_07575 [Candidatus Omnitrophota bacterium]|nr:hypothetical protein [Candidatus Omnitrophota bacterium]